MTISELIEALERIKKDYGNIPVEYVYNDLGHVLPDSTEIRKVAVENDGRGKKVVIE